MSVNVEKLEVEISALEYKESELEGKIHDLSTEQHKIRKEIAEKKEIIQRNKYYGMRRWEYFESIAKTEYVEGDYKVIIGYMGGSTVYVETMEGDLKVYIYSNFDSDTAPMILSRNADYQKGTRYYERRYWESEIPKKRQVQYKEMLALKVKYGQMMENAEIKPKIKENAK
jgi:hypothetical protein